MDSKVKRCRCSPSCYKWLGYEARQKHYRKADDAEMLNSDHGSDPSDVNDTSDTNDPDSNDNIHSPSPILADNMAHTFSNNNDNSGEDEMSTTEDFNQGKIHIYIRKIY
jgi:hypothetical protein